MKAEIKKMAKAGQHVCNLVKLESCENDSKRYSKNERSNREND